MLSIRISQGIGNTLFHRGLALLAGLAAFALLAGLALPPGALAGPADAGTCPLTTPVFTARLDAKSYATAVGQPARLRVRLNPRTVPEGFFVTSIIDVLSGPAGQKPRILTGHPVSDVTPREPGTYRLRVLVNLIAKSSCAGVKAVTLLDQEIVLVAH